MPKTDWHRGAKCFHFPLAYLLTGPLAYLPTCNACYNLAVATTDC